MEPTRTPKLAPYLTTHDATGLIRFIESGIGGRVTFLVRDDEGRVAHAEVRIADGVVMLGENPADRPPFPAMIHLYVPDADAAHQRALGAGAVSVRDPSDGGGGDRRGGVRDAWGNEWWFTQAGAGSA